MEATSKADAIRRYLIKNGSITSLQAIDLFRATRLSAIIFNLKKKGYKFETERLSHKDEYGHNISFARYKLVGWPDEA